VLPAQEWLDEEKVVGLGVAEKLTDSKPSGELSLTVRVTKKRVPVRRSERVAEYLEVPGVDGSILTDVREIGDVRLQSAKGRVQWVPKTHAAIGDASYVGFTDAQGLLRRILIWPSCCGVAGVGDCRGQGF